jgi:hypothetical protein
LVIFEEKDGRYGGKSIFLKGQIIVSPFLIDFFSILLKKMLASIQFEASIFLKSWVAQKFSQKRRAPSSPKMHALKL